LQLFSSYAKRFFPRGWLQLAIFTDERRGEALVTNFQWFVAPLLAEQAFVHGRIPDALDAYEVVIACEHIALAAQAAVGANRNRMGQVGFAAEVSAAAVH